MTFNVLQPLIPVKQTQATALTLSLCNKYVDHWAAMDSGASGIFMDDTYRGDDHQETDNGIIVKGVVDQ